jgi:hypothetical protein
LQAAFVVGSSPANEGTVNAIESPMTRSVEVRVFIDILHKIHAVMDDRICGCMAGNGFRNSQQSAEKGLHTCQVLAETQD